MFVFTNERNELRKIIASSYLSAEHWRSHQAVPAFRQLTTTVVVTADATAATYVRT